MTDNLDEGTPVGDATGFFELVHCKYCRNGFFATACRRLPGAAVAAETGPGFGLPLGENSGIFQIGSRTPRIIGDKDTALVAYGSLSFADLGAFN